MRHLVSGLLLLFALLGPLSPGNLRAETLAESFSSVRTEQTTVTLLSDSASVTPGSTFHLGFHFEMIPEWHVYWKNPGDSGLPPKVRWSLPAGVSAGEFAWPTPERIPLGPLANYGYSEEVLFATPITVPRDAAAGSELSIEAELSWLICKEDCIPQEGEFTLSLPITDRTEAEPSVQKLFGRFRARLPAEPPKKLRVTEIDAQRVRIELPAPGLDAHDAAKGYFFSETRALVNPASPQTATLSGDTLTIEARKAATFQTLPLSVRGIVRFDSEHGWAAATDAEFEREAPPAAQSGTQGLLALILSALLGGAILNLMPCVFPILSIKILGLVEHSRDSLRARAVHGLSFALGVVLSFAALGVVLLALREAGSRIGWGFQMQSPLVVGSMALLFFLLGLMFLGTIEIGGRLSTAGAKLDNRSGILGSFLSGLLAVLVAAPCTAPFMGAAIGAALTLGTFSTLAVFIALGIGMAAPYLALITFPRLLNLLPRPGAWMERLKQFMAFPLFATTIWLLWVLSIQSGGFAVAVILSACLLCAFGIWILQGPRAGLFSKIFGILVFLSGVSLVLVPFAPASETASASGPHMDSYGLTWEPFSPALLEKYLAEGRVIYLDFTAAWCLTCQVNKALTLSSSELRDTFRSLNVALLRGDWTNQDPVITETLKRYGRAGVPLNVVLGGASRTEPTVLPALLTPDLIGAALKERVRK